MSTHSSSEDTTLTESIDGINISTGTYSNDGTTFTEAIGGINNNMVLQLSNAFRGFFSACSQICFQKYVLQFIYTKHTLNTSFFWKKKVTKHRLSDLRWKWQNFRAGYHRFRFSYVFQLFLFANEQIKLEDHWFMLLILSFFQKGHFSPPANFGFRKKCWYRRVNERFRYESPGKPTLSAVMLLEKT